MEVQTVFYFCAVAHFSSFLTFTMFRQNVLAAGKDGDAGDAGEIPPAIGGGH